MIELKTLKELVKLMVANELTELDVQDPQGERVTLKRGHAPAPGGGVPVMHYVPAPAHAAPLPTASAAGAASPPPAAGDGLVAIPSPMVGTFYAAASPDAKPFVNPGDRVNLDTVVCILEAMKVFNEIKAETAGTIEKVLVQSGQAVEFGQPLFMVKPG